MSDAVVFGRYQIIRRLATGGMGEIFLARQRGAAGFDRLAILKSLLPELADDEGSLSAFLDEARLAAHLNHPNVVAVYEVDRWEGVYFLAMEYIAGIDLARLSKIVTSQGSRTPPALVAAVFRDACRGLGYAHSALDAGGTPLNLVHRDATPHNIMLRKDGTVKVVDFGVAKAANRAVRTAAGLLKGKLQYMPPEQVRGEEVTARSDQWALGASLWELLVGHRLIAPTEPMDVFRTVLAGRFPLPSTVIDGIPPELDAIVGRMIAPSVDARFSSCIEAADALEEFVRSSGLKQAQVAEFVARVAGPTIDAVTADLSPQPVSIQGRTASPPGFRPAPKSPTPADTVTAAMPTPSARYCGQCGTPAPATGRFCTRCGTALSPGSPHLAAPAAAPPPAAPPAPQTPPGESLLVSVGAKAASPPTSGTDRSPEVGQMPLGRSPTLPPTLPPTPYPAVPERPLIDVGALGLAAADALMKAVSNEKRTVCVVRASISGAFAAPHEPELALQRAKAVSDALSKAIVDGGGIVENSSADNILFSLGAERTAEDDAVVAVRLALALEDLVGRCAAAWGIAVGLRAAVDIGTAIVTDTPQGKRVSGAPKDRATRIERRVDTPRVLASVDIAQLVRRSFELSPPFSVRDDGNTIDVVHVLRAAQAVDAAVVFVGRERELELAQRACSARPSTTFVVGPQGAGRTALLEAVGRWASSVGLPVHWVRARGFSGPHAVARALVVGNADVDGARSRLHALALPEATVGRVLRLFFGDGAGGRRTESHGVEALVLDESAIADALEASARGGVVLVDDWGSVDAGSRAGLLRMTRRGSTPVALLATANADDVLPEGHTRILLEPLGEAALRALVGGMLGVGDVPQALVAYVVLHAQGNPSLARLIVEGLRDAGVLAVTNGRASVAPNVASTPAPASLSRVYEARFDRLTEETRALLRAAAVAGEQFSLDFVAAMVGVDRQLRAPTLLAPAEKAGLVVALSSTHYAFTQASLRASVQGRMMQNDAVALHARALELLMPAADDQDASGLETIAQHAEACRDDKLFSTWAWRAARAHDAHGARREALVWFRRATDAAVRLVRRTSGPADHTSAVVIATEAMRCALQFDAPVALELEKLVAASMEKVPPEIRLWALRAHGRALVAAGRAKEAADVFDAALEVVAEGDEDTRALLLSDLGGALEAIDDIQGAVAQLVEAFRRMKGRQSRYPEFSFEAFNRLGRLYLRSRLTAQAREAFELARTQAEALGDLSLVARCLMNLGTCAAMDGSGPLAGQLFADSVSRADQAGDVLQASRARLNLGRFLLASDPARARGVLQKALADAERVEWKEGIALARNALALVRTAPVGSA
jgi:tetratricopeptide (TPR) repeat protein